MLGMRGVDPQVERAWRNAAAKIGAKPKREIWISTCPQGWLVEVGYSDGINLHPYRQFQEKDWDNVQRIVANHTKRFRCPIKVEGFYMGEQFDYR